MSHEYKQLMEEMQHLFKKQNALLDKHYSDSEVNFECRITDSEMRQTERH
jgi:hypothetical protein